MSEPERRQVSEIARLARVTVRMLHHYDEIGLLVAQRELLVKKRRRMETVIRSVDQTLHSLERGATMSTDAMFERAAGLAAFVAAAVRANAERSGATCDGR